MTGSSESFAKHLRAPDGRELPLDSDPRAVPAGSMVAYNLERAHDERLSIDRLGAPEATGIWRYARFLPPVSPERRVTLGEGGTPWLPARRLAASLGLRSLFVKDEGRNPTGTFKDRGAAMCVSRLAELGVRDIVMQSSGNASAAFAVYSARAGIACTCVVPDDVLPSNMETCRRAGATVRVVEGAWHRAKHVVAEEVERGAFDASTLREPYRLEGKKTMGFELVEQCHGVGEGGVGDLPDVIVYPTGGGLGPIAIYKALHELRDAGMLPRERLPRLIVTQYEGCAPIVRAHAANAEDVTPWGEICIPPGGLKSPHPPGGARVLTILRETGGGAIAVSSEAAFDAVDRLARTEGIFACPESATTLAGLTEALARGLVERDERVALWCTGSGLKSIANFEAAASYQRES